MQKIGLYQSLGQKLSPQQIQFIKLLQVSTLELESRIEEELEINPALEEGQEESNDDSSEVNINEESREDKLNEQQEISLEEYLKNDDYAGYKMQGDGNGDEEERETPIATTTTLLDYLLDQVGYLNLNEHQLIIAKQLIGSIESDGYIRRDLEAILNDLAFAQNIETTIEELTRVLSLVQTLDPAGIGARDLQECLLLQLKRLDVHNQDIQTAIEIVEHHFQELTKKHFDKLIHKYNLSDDDAKRIIHIITKLNPKPGASSDFGGKAQYVIPDFILTNDNGILSLTLNARNAPELRISRSYTEMLRAYEQNKKKDRTSRETITFVKQKLDAAKWFIDAIKQRQATLLKTMEAIIARQKEFFLHGEDTLLRPMILKDIAQAIDMDISTVSRVASSKTIQTEFGTFPLKYFFSESLSTESGEDVSSREVKSILKTIIDEEEKHKPLSDDDIEKILRQKGYNIARRTVAKYREQLNIPVARLRKEL